MPTNVAQLPLHVRVPVGLDLNNVDHIVLPCIALDVHHDVWPGVDWPVFAGSAWTCAGQGGKHAVWNVHPTQCTRRVHPLAFASVFAANMCRDDARSCARFLDGLKEAAAESVVSIHVHALHGVLACRNDVHAAVFVVAERAGRGRCHAISVSHSLVPEGACYSLL